MELFLADFVNVPEYVEKFLSVPRPWSQHEYILYTPGFANLSWKYVKFPIKNKKFSLKNQKLNLRQIFFAHLKFSIIDYFSCHNGSKKP